MAAVAISVLVGKADREMRVPDAMHTIGTPTTGNETRFLQQHLHLDLRVFRRNGAMGNAVLSSLFTDHAGIFPQPQFVNYNNNRLGFCRNSGGKRWPVNGFLDMTL